MVARPAGVTAKNFQPTAHDLSFPQEYIQVNARTKALNALNELRADDAKLPDPHSGHSTIQVWKALAAAFPFGADVLPEVAKMVGQIVGIIGRAVDDPFAVRIDRDNGVIVGLIVCPDAFGTKLVHMTIRESVVTLDGTPYFVGRARGREALRLALLGTVIKLIETVP